MAVPVHGYLRPRTLELYQQLLAVFGQIEIGRIRGVPRRDYLHRHMAADLEQINSCVAVAIGLHLQIAIRLILTDSPKNH